MYQQYCDGQTATHTHRKRGPPAFRPWCFGLPSMWGQEASVGKVWARVWTTDVAPINVMRRLAAISTREVTLTSETEVGGKNSDSRSRLFIQCSVPTKQLYLRVGSDPRIKGS